MIYMVAWLLLRAPPRQNGLNIGNLPCRIEYLGVSGFATAAECNDTVFASPEYFSVTNSIYRPVTFWILLNSFM